MPSKVKTLYSLLKWIGLGLGALAAITVLSVVILWWIGLQRLEAESVIVSTRLGPMEYTSTGEGPPVLILHGSPGGYDQFLPLARALADRGHRAITISRPGYLRTPQDLGRTPEEQADAYAAFLDALEVPRTFVIGVSGGGPSTLQFALRHPDRVQGLVLVCAVAKRLLEEEPHPDELQPFDLIWDLGALAARFFPTVGLQFLGIDSDADRKRYLADPETLQGVQYLFQSLGFNSHRPGYVNDMLTYGWDDLDYPLERLRAPTLLLHGSNDTNVPLAHSQKVAAGVPGAELKVLEGAGPAFFVLEHQWLEDQIVGFFRMISTSP